MILGKVVNLFSFCYNEHPLSDAISGIYLGPLWLRWLPEDVTLASHYTGFSSWTRIDLASSTRAAEKRTKWKELVIMSSVVARRPSKVMG